MQENAEIEESETSKYITLLKVCFEDYRIMLENTPRIFGEDLQRFSLLSIVCKIIMIVNTIDNKSMILSDTEKAMVEVAKNKITAVKKWFKAETDDKLIEIMQKKYAALMEGFLPKEPEKINQNTSKSVSILNVKKSKLNASAEEYIPASSIRKTKSEQLVNKHEKEILSVSC